MIFVFIFTFAIGFTIYCWFDSYGDIVPTLLGLLLGILTGLFFGLLTILLCIGIMSCGEPAMETYETETIELIALKDGSLTEGHSFLGSGYINEDLNYVYLYNKDGKGITTGKVKANDNTYINYITDESTPRLEIKNTKPENDFLYFLSSWTYTGIEYYFYLPEGSIIAESTYIVDLE